MRASGLKGAEGFIQESEKGPWQDTASDERGKSGGGGRRLALLLLYLSIRV